ncbi:MAG: transglycosylase SLT domain-containing protein [Candidatus Magasanikbacteria bacterium]|jgi:hypothetical protein|nr:transglycosylase SLT domain-containing protein [Candidatus Magasanikbacteria bacterium]
MHTLIKRLSLVCCVLTLLLFASPALAISAQPITSELVKDAGSPTVQISIPGLEFSEEPKLIDEGLDKYMIVPFLGEYIGAVYQYSVVIVSIISVVMVIVGGVVYSMSGGNPTQTGQAKKIIANAFIGLILAVGSYTILFTINPDLVVMKDLKIKYIDPLELDELEFDKNTVFLTSFNLSNEQMDELFQTYAGCFGYDWRILKAVAAAESGLNPNARRPGSQYHGLFQMSLAYCAGGLKDGKMPAELGFDCTNRIEPETNTASAAGTINRNLKRIQKACPNITIEHALTLLYVGHNNGPAVMNEAIRDKACNQPAIRNAVQNFYVSRGGRNGKVTTQYGLKKHDYGRDKVVSILKGLGVQANAPLFPSGALKADKCPINTKERLFKNTCDPVMTYSCPRSAGKKVLALGDSNTDSAKSYADALKQKCPGITIVKEAKFGENANYLFNQIKNKNLGAGGERYDDIIVWAGVNNITGAKAGLTKIYDKATQDGVRIIAVSVTPWKGYGAHTGSGLLSEQYQRATNEVNAWMRAGAEGKLAGNNIFIDAYAKFGDTMDPDVLKSSCANPDDKIHLNANGQSILGDMIAKAAYN